MDNATLFVIGVVVSIPTIIVIVALIINAIVSRAIECFAYGLILFSGGFLVCFYMVEAYYRIEDVSKKK